jgi:hypothetical protein
MTMLAVTVTKTGAVLSQDSWLYQLSEAGRDHARRSAGITDNVQEAAASCYVGGGDATEIKLLGQGLKILAVPRFNMAIAATGPFAVALHWWMRLMEAHAVTIEALHAGTPQALAEVHQTVAPNDAAVIVHAGFDPVSGKGFGRVFSSDDGFAGTDLPVGTTAGPPPDPDDEKYATIAELWNAASDGRQVEELHRALFDQQLRAMAAGKLAPGTAVGGQLNHVAVSASGITITAAAG